MTQQLTLALEPDLIDRHSSLTECVAAGIYQRGLVRVAGKLNKAPGNLTRELAGDSDRHFSTKSLEEYIEAYNDLTPIYYLIAKFLGDKAVAETAMMTRIEDLLAQVATVAAQLPNKKPTRR